jgi:hypothetical protein
MEHELKILSLHDAQAWCSCGKWAYIRTGPATREQIKLEHATHVEYRKQIEVSRG